MGSDDVKAREKSQKREKEGAMGRLLSVPGDGRRAPADDLLRAVVAQIDRHRRELNSDPGLRQVRLTVRFRDGRVRYAQIERASECELEEDED
jgi:hypothetical protein